MSTVSSTDSASPAATTDAPKVWLITGCASGLGRELALAALARGDRVIATARTADRLQDLAQRGALALALDVTWSDDAVRETVATAVEVYGRIDILVNNAAYSLVGAIEECSGDEIADVFRTNVFGVCTMVRAVLPVMRAQRSGVIANIGSIGGRKGFAASGVYCATKFAVAGLSETLREEVAHLGIDVTCVDLGWFRTPFIDNFVRAKQSRAASQTADGDTDASSSSSDNSSSTESPAVAFMQREFVTRNGTQSGDPARAARVLVDALTKSGRCAGRARLPVRLSIGSETVQFVSDVLARDERELLEWADAVAGTDFGDKDDGSGDLTDDGGASVAATSAAIAP